MHEVEILLKKCKILDIRVSLKLKKKLDWRPYGPQRGSKFQTDVIFKSSHLNPDHETSKSTSSSVEVELCQHDMTWVLV